MTVNSRIRVGVVLIKKNSILLVRMHRDSGDIFVLPGGGLNVEEGIFECAKREVKEETGLTVEVEKILYLKDLITRQDHALEIVLLGKIIDGEVIKGKDPEDKGKNILKDVAWINFEELEDITLHPKQLKARIEKDHKNGFKGTRYLGKFVYPE